MSRSRNATTTEDAILHAIDLLTEELKVLRMVIDELRDEVQWHNQNPRTNSDCSTGLRIRSLSLDPTRRDFQVNSVEPETVNRLRAELTSVDSKSSKQRELFR
jgi:hypothetical protein